MRQHWTRYTDEELGFIEALASLPRRRAHAAFCELFGRTDVSLTNFKALCVRRGWHTGRTGRFEKGLTPHNKGRKMPYNANNARTQFKKGCLSGKASMNYKPIGAERLSQYGYIERKVHDGRPVKSRWRLAHLINWEAENGPVADGHRLKCLDGDKTNTAPSNWICVPLTMMPRLNGMWCIGYADAPAELKPIILATAKLEVQVREISRNRRHGFAAEPPGKGGKAVEDEA